MISEQSLKQKRILISQVNWSPENEQIYLEATLQ